MKSKWTVVARHRWLVGCKITESQSGNPPRVRFTATIRGWRGWTLYEGHYHPGLTDMIIDLAGAIRDRIDTGDETVFHKEALRVKRNVHL